MGIWSATPAASIHQGRDAIHAFYVRSMQTAAKLRLEGPVGITRDDTAFAFSVHPDYDAATKRIDTFRFDEDNQVIAMRAT